MLAMSVFGAVSLAVARVADYTDLTPIQQYPMDQFNQFRNPQPEEGYVYPEPEDW